MKTLYFIFLILISCVTASNPVTDFEASAMVERVIDGDTFVISFNGEDFPVRVLGCDAFETRHGKRLERQAREAGISTDSALELGKAGKRFADSLLNKKFVILKRDKINFDKYGRLLRYVFIENKRYDSILIANKLAL